ncbi:MAG: hypothetical protein AB7I04_12110 [Pseudomonadales bacterium]
MSDRTLEARVPVVVILAQSHSGSHLLSQLLGAHSRCLAIGELHNYDKFVHRKSRSGNVTADYAHNVLFSGLESAPQQRWHELILANARAGKASVSTLVDNSKRIAWCRKLLANPRLQVIPVHLIRDPRAMLRYWMLRYDTSRKLRRQRLRLARQAPLQAARLLTCPPRELYLRKWLIDNREMTRALRASGHADNVVTYHDLATSTEKALVALMPRLGLDYEPAQLRYGEAIQHGTLKADYREASQSSQIRLDVRWQTFLSESEARAVAEDTRLAGYLAELNLMLTPQGLTRRR